MSDDDLLIYSDEFEGGSVRISELTIISREFGSITVMDGFGVEVEFNTMEMADETFHEERRQTYDEFYVCDHPQTALRSKFTKDNREMVRPQCLVCGRSAGAQIKKIDWPAEREPWDEEIELQIRERQNKRIDEIELRAFARHQARMRDRKGEYSDYLNSPKWKGIRRDVLIRDKYLCQGCLRNKATQVHHLTYENIYDELMFQLVSVCDACHRKIHPDKG